MVVQTLDEILQNIIDGLFYLEVFSLVSWQFLVYFMVNYEL